MIGYGQGSDGTITTYSSSYFYSSNWFSNGLIGGNTSSQKNFATHSHYSESSSWAYHKSQDYGSYAEVYNSNYGELYFSSQNRTLVDSSTSDGNQAYFKSYHSHSTEFSVTSNVRYTTSGASELISSGYESRFYSFNSSSSHYISGYGNRTWTWNSYSQSIDFRNISGHGNSGFEHYFMTWNSGTLMKLW